MAYQKQTRAEDRTQNQEQRSRLLHSITRVGQQSTIFFRLIRHCRSRMSSESPKHGHTKHINPTIWILKSEFYSIFLSCFARMLLSDIRSGSSFRVTVHVSQVLISAKNNLSCTRPFPNAAFIRYIWPCLSDWDDICGTKWRLKCPKIFFLEWKKGENNNKNAHHSIQSERLPCSQSTGLSSWSLLSSVYLFSAVYRSNWYGCGPVSYTHLTLPTNHRV